MKAGLFARWVALVIDPLIALVLYFGALALLSSVSGGVAGEAAFGLALLYIIWFLSLLRRGTTPGKRVMGLQVVRTQTGDIPGFGVMFVREVVGRFVSGVFLGLGYLWAVFDMNGQAWHDKIASTVVVRVR
ncbi:MAG: RDD family protein [Gemmatimonadaceae bacterium]|nr:RDD family protein [Gemmatimonadaceae bacterium]